MIFLVFQIFNDVKNFSYTMHLKGDFKTFNLTTFQSIFVYMKSTYGIFKLFSILFNFLLALLWQAVSFQPLYRIEFSKANFFRFVLTIVLLKKNWVFLLFWALLGHFPYSLFLFFFDFWFFYSFKYSTMSKILAILCIWKVTSRLSIRPLFDSNFVDMKKRYGIFKMFSIFFSFC